MLAKWKVLPFLNWNPMKDFIPWRISTFQLFFPTQDENIVQIFELPVRLKFWILFSSIYKTSQVQFWKASIQMVAIYSLHRLCLERKNNILVNVAFKWSVAVKGWLHVSELNWVPPNHFTSCIVCVQTASKWGTRVRHRSFCNTDARNAHNAATSEQC